MARTSTTLTLADLLECFGPLPLTRIRYDPSPGTATEEDVIAIEAQEDRLFELVNGVLVEKVMGFYESFLALRLGQLLGAFVDQHVLGIVAGEAGMLRLAPGLVRIPDVSFIARERLPGGRVPRQPIPDLAPDLAVEVLSEGNTAREMERKLQEYFAAGVRLVWYVAPVSQEIHVYTSPDQHTVLTITDTLQGGDVLPGFRLPVQQLFTEPTAETDREP
ncbi:MAG: Uma2 family endonuclease [Candidatus Tectomicrobia bacterium]|uniref:Uma2 family endonuclease n=1 Tax=Tectimicrobiota bacterium TaxID=2528274 RepID=A0A937W092_UNCTE|nr:Uma2 family endonuclease [Candidatus Tectomicrobia bacterium]